MDALVDDLVRARRDAPFRSDDDTGLGVLYGIFARFGEWTEISSWYEGNFLERIQRGAFAKTLQESRESIKVLYDHGHDPSIGNKVLGSIAVAEEKSDGAHYEVPLFDTAYNRELAPGLTAGVYGASFRFRVIQDEWHDEPGTSEHNPQGLPERTIKEVRLYEFGPVTFPAYATATAGLRSMTDAYLAHRYAADPAALERLAAVASDLRTSTEAAGNSPSEPPPALGMTDDERARALTIHGVTQ